MTPPLEHALAGRTLIVVSNREPYEHVGGTDDSGAPRVRRPAGGLVSALDPTMRRTHGVWVAWGSGAGDRDSVDERDRVMVPPEEPAYALRRVWLDDADVDGYYLGFANSALWPLCHLLLQHYDYRAEYWDRYRAVNRRFAEAAADEAARADGQPVIWVQDYHFALAPAMLREHLAREGDGRRALIHQFWHIPFPPPDILRLLPFAVYEAVLRGLLGNDLVEFHTERHVANFLDCVAEFVPNARVRREEHRVYLDDRVVHAQSFPISIDVEHYEGLATSEEGAARAAELRRRYTEHGCTLSVSVDRIDYTKGIPERLRALDELWDQAPELRECMTFLLVATPSRSDLASYKALEEEVVDGVTAINTKYGTPDWTPIVLVKENVDAAMLASIYRAADLCLVSSLQDGMNLVAKEFIACNVDEQGVLVLSRFAGAAEEMDGAVLINPFNVDGFVAGLRSAIKMPPDERQERMRRMRTQLHSATIFDWLEGILTRVDELAPDAGDAPAADAPHDAPPADVAVPLTAHAEGAPAAAPPTGHTPAAPTESDDRVAGAV